VKTFSTFTFLCIVLYTIILLAILSFYPDYILIHGNVKIDVRPQKYFTILYVTMIFTSFYTLTYSLLKYLKKEK